MPELKPYRLSEAQRAAGWLLLLAVVALVAGLMARRANGQGFGSFLTDKPFLAADAAGTGAPDDAPPLWEKLTLWIQPSPSNDTVFTSVHGTNAYSPTNGWRFDRINSRTVPYTPVNYFTNSGDGAADTWFSLYYGTNLYGNSNAYFNLWSGQSGNFSSAKPYFQSKYAAPAPGGVSNMWSCILFMPNFETITYSDCRMVGWGGDLYIHADKSENGTLVRYMAGQGTANTIGSLPITNWVVMTVLWTKKDNQLVIRTNGVEALNKTNAIANALGTFPLHMSREQGAGLGNGMISEWLVYHSDEAVTTNQITEIENYMRARRGW